MGGKNNATHACYHVVYFLCWHDYMDIDGLRRWWNNSRIWSHSWRSWRRSWRSRWLNSNAWRGNFQQPKHGRLKAGEENWATTGRGEQDLSWQYQHADACGCFANWELPLKSIVSVAGLTEEKRAEEAETKNQELEVQIFWNSCPTRVSQPSYFWGFQFLRWFFMFDFLTNKDIESGWNTYCSNNIQCVLLRILIRYSKH